MKTHIDLLPESRKMLMAKKKRFKEILKQEILFIFPILIFILMLVGINLIITVQNSGIDESHRISSSQDNYKDLKLYEDQTKNINKKSLIIRNFKENHFKWSDVIIEVGESFSDKITLSDFSTKDYQIFLVGKADERDALIELRDKISMSDCFENVNVPLSNLVVKDNIDFQMDFYVKKECLIKE